MLYNQHLIIIQTQINKIESLVTCLDTYFTNGETFIYCDTDILHNRNCIDDISHLLQSNDAVAQDSFSENKSQQFCSGFFAAKKTDKIMYFLRSILSGLKTQLDNENFADQYFFNKFSNMIKCHRLNKLYFNPGAVTFGNVIPDGLIEKLATQIPKDSFIVHANWTKGTQNKIKLLQYAKQYLRTE
jgi:hypothetical protein